MLNSVPPRVLSRRLHTHSLWYLRVKTDRLSKSVRLGNTGNQNCFFLQVALRAPFINFVDLLKTQTLEFLAIGCSLGKFPGLNEISKLGPMFGFFHIFQGRFVLKL